MSKKTIFCLTVLTLILLASSSSSQRRGWGSWPNWLTKETEDRSPVAVWRADYGVTTVDTGGTYPTVSNWLSTNGLYNAVQPTASMRPLYNDDSVTVDFDGVDDYLYVPASESSIFNPGTMDFSIELWLKTGSDVATAQKLIGKGTALPSRVFWQVQIYNSFIQAFVNAIGEWPAWCFLQTKPVSTNRLYHFVFSVDRDGEQAVYLNGNKNSFQAVTRTDDQSPTTDLFIGKHSDPAQMINYFMGELILIRYYKVALTQSEVEALYKVGRPR